MTTNMTPKSRVVREIIASLPMYSLTELRRAARSSAFPEVREAAAAELARVQGEPK